MGQPITLIVPPERRLEEEDVLARLRLGKVVDHFQTECCAKDGRCLQISLTTSPIRDSAGRIVGASKVARDITEQKRTEAAVRVAQAEAEDANRAKDIFLATLSHELRTPLNAIVGWMSILRSDGCDADDLKEGLIVIERNANAQVQLIEDVLDVSRIVSGKLRLEMQSASMADLIRAGVDTVRPAAEARDIRLEIDLDPAMRPIRCDPTRVQQIIWNLLSNAIKFTPKGGTVGVKMRPADENVRIEIRDTGQGIAADLLPHIFDRFRQADGSSRRKFGGLGLGLSIVKHLAEMHGGTVEAASAGDGQGSVFTVELPHKGVDSYPVDPIQSAGARREGTEASPAPCRLDGLRVLVVDDEFDSRRMISRVLEGVGAVVIAVESVSAALQVLGTTGQSTRVADAIVSDLGMPEQDGYDLIREVRRRGHHARDLPAVALTGFAHKDDAREAIRAGFQVHVPKPVDVYDLTAILASLVGHSS